MCGWCVDGLCVGVCDVVVERARGGVDGGVDDGDSRVIGCDGGD